VFFNIYVIGRSTCKLKLNFFFFFNSHLRYYLRLFLPESYVFNECFLQSTNTCLSCRPNTHENRPKARTHKNPKRWQIVVCARRDGVLSARSATAKPAPRNTARRNVRTGTVRKIKNHGRNGVRTNEKRHHHMYSIIVLLDGSRVTLHKANRTRRTRK